MFEHLDPPSVPEPDEGALDRIKAGAHARRRRLIGAGAGGGGLLALVLFLVLSLLLGGGTGPSRRLTATGPDRTTTTTPEPSTTAPVGGVGTTEAPSPAHRSGAGTAQPGRSPRPSSDTSPHRRSGILFEREGDLWIMNADGSGQALLAHPPRDEVAQRNVTGADWSADRKTVFLAASEKYGNGLYTVSPDGGPLRDMGVGASGSPAVSPDGKKIAIVNYWFAGWNSVSLDVMNSDGTGLRHLDPKDVSPLVGQRPSWTPDGTRIIFVGTGGNSSTTTTLLPAAPASRLWSVDADGSNLQRIEGFTDATQAALSPDGTRVAFVKQHCSAQTGTCNKPQIYIGTADGTNVHALTHDSASDTSPVWSPDGARLVFSSDVGGTAAIWAINADGTGLNRLTTAPAGPPTAWG